MMRIWLAALVISMPLSARAVEDTPANRAAQADYYLQASRTLDDLLKESFEALPPGDRELLTKHLNMDAIAKEMRASVIKHFTADELKALGDFYSSPHGKSVMSKFGAWMNDFMPAMQREFEKAAAAVQREKDTKK